MKILISAGPTREYIDPVRFISNPSTGKMGYLIARSAVKSGHTVILVSGPTHLPPPPGVDLVRVETTREMRQSIISIFPSVDLLIMSAAVSDWKPAERAAEKIKKKESWVLPLVPNPDILKEISSIKRDNQRVIGFALETENIIENAQKKLQNKNLDMIVADTPAFFGAGRPGRVAFIFKDGRVDEYSSISKEETAEKIMEVEWKI